MRSHNQRIQDVDESYLKQQHIHISREVCTQSEGKKTQDLFIAHVLHKRNRALCWLMRIIHPKKRLPDVLRSAKEPRKFCNLCLILLKPLGRDVAAGWLLAAGRELGRLKKRRVGRRVLELGPSVRRFIVENFFLGGFGVVGFGVVFDIPAFFSCTDSSTVCRKSFLRSIRLLGSATFTMTESIWDLAFKIEGSFFAERANRLLNFTNPHDLQQALPYLEQVYSASSWTKCAQNGLASPKQSRI